MTARWKLRDVVAGVLESDESATARQRDRFVKACGPRHQVRSLPLLVGPLFARTGFGIIWIDHALGGSARRRTLSHRSVATFEVEVHHIVVDLKANRVVWIVGLSLCRRGKHDRADR
jgi:hypothetical protein